MVAGKALTDNGISAQVLVLVEETIREMLWFKAKILLMVVGLGLTIGGAGWAGSSGFREHSKPELTAQVLPEKGRKDQSPSRNQGEKKKSDQAEEKRTDSRGDPLPEGAFLRFGSAQLRHGGTIYASALSPDGKILATAGKSSVILWNLDTGKPLQEFRCEDTLSFSHPGLTFSPDGTRLGYLRSNYFACVWDLQNGKEIRRFERKFQDGVKKFWESGCYFLNDGKEFVLCSREAIHIWLLDSGEEVSATPVARLQDVSPDGKISRRGDEKGGAVLADTRTGKELLRIPDVRQPGSRGLVFSPDCKTLAVMVSNAIGAKEIQIRETATGKVLTFFPPPDSAQRKDVGEIAWEYRPAFSPDGKTLLLGTWSGYIHRFDVATGKELSVLTKHYGEVTGMHLLSDGRSLISTGRDGVIRRWDLQTGQHDAEPDSYEGKSQGAFSADGKLIAIGDARGRVDLWDARSGKLICNLQQEGTATYQLAFAPDSKLLAAAERSGTVRFWQIPSGTPGAVWRHEQGRGEWCNSLHFSPDGRFICISDYPKHIRLMNVASGQVLWVGPSTYGEAFFPDGDKLLVAAPAGPNLSILDVKTSQKTIAIRLNTNISDRLGVEYTFAFSSDGRHLALAFPGALMLCDGRTCVEKKRLADHDLDVDRLPLIQLMGGKTPNHIMAIAFAPDGKWFASAGSDGAIYIWETLTCEQVLRLPGHNDYVSGVSFSPDGRTIFSYGQDGQAYAWHLPPKTKAPGNLKELWSDLTDKKAAKAYEALWAIIGTPKESVPVLKEMLKPIPAADPGKVQKWIADLDSETFAIRQAAAKELEIAGDQVQVPIQRALQGSPSLETRRRMELILKNLADVPGPETIRAIRAIMALERIGTPEARSGLERLAGGAPGARETEEAKASLERLSSKAP